MTIDQIISFASSLGTLLAALATFLTIRQLAMQRGEMEKSRQSSYRPQIAVLGAPLLCGKKPLEDYWSFLYWKERNSSASEEYLEARVRIENVGLGAALYLAYEWSCDFEEFAKLYNNAAASAKLPERLEIREGKICSTTHRWSWSAKEQGSVDYVLPLVAKPGPVTLRLPAAFLASVSEALFMWKNGPAQPRFTFPALHLELRFQDIGGEQHRAAFYVMITPHSLTADGYEASLHVARPHHNQFASS